jgi:hypothetical protein
MPFPALLLLLLHHLLLLVPPEHPPAPLQTHMASQALAVAVAVVAADVLPGRRQQQQH